MNRTRLYQRIKRLPQATAACKETLALIAESGYFIRKFFTRSCNHAVARVFQILFPFEIRPWHPPPPIPQTDNG
jgi:hypothetical protein